MPHDPNPWFLAKTNLRYFTKKFVGLDWPKHYTEWANVINGNKRALFESPRGSWKSYFFSLVYPLWRILRGKTEILLVSDSEGQAVKNLRIMRQTIESRDELAPMRPSTKELWGTDQIMFSNGSMVSIMGFGTSKRGTHPDIIINDDIEGENNRMSREDKDRMYFGVISGMALPHTDIYTVGTPIEFGDILEQLSKNEVYAKWKRPSEVSGTNQYKDIWTDEWLAFRKQEMGSLNYAREMMLQRIDPATAPFKRQYETFYTELPGRFVHIVTVCDPAYSENQGDYTGIITVGFTGGNHAYILEAKGIRREDPGMVVNELIRTIKTWKPQVVGIEKRKGQAIHYSFEEARTRLNLWDFKYVELETHGQSKDKRVNMVGGLVSRWEARSIHMHADMNLLRAQLMAYRFDHESTDHDDLVDALAYCFHPEIIEPNSGPVSVPRDAEEASQVGRPRYQLGRDAMWQPSDAPMRWTSGRVQYGDSWASMLDRRTQEVTS